MHVREVRKEGSMMLKHKSKDGPTVRTEWRTGDCLWRCIVQ